MLFTPLISIFFFNDTATTEIYTLSLHDALPISQLALDLLQRPRPGDQPVLQVGPQAGEAECDSAVGGALLGGALALTGQLLAAGWLPDVVVLDRSANG